MKISPLCTRRFILFHVLLKAHYAADVEMFSAHGDHLLLDTESPGVVTSCYRQ